MHQKKFHLKKNQYKVLDIRGINKSDTEGIPEVSEDGSEGRRRGGKWGLEDL